MTMRKCLLTLTIALGFLVATTQAQDRQRTLMLRLGAAFDGEGLNYGPQGAVDISAFWSLTDGYDIGLRLGTVAVNGGVFLPASLTVRTHLVEGPFPLNLWSSLGYSLGTRTFEDSWDWGGVHMGLALESSFAFSHNIRLHYSIDYLLQEHKYRTLLLDFIDSEMRHILSINLGVSTYF